MSADLASDTTATPAQRVATAPNGGPALTHKQIVTILIGLMMGMFLAALDQTIVASSIRTIADDLNGLSAQAWVTTAYLITSTIVTPLYGKLSDIYGRKPFFIFAISIFTVGSALCSFATSIGTLATYRAVQGLGAGGLFALALAIIGDIVPPRERAKYQGYFLAVFGTSSVLGPVIGGFFAGQSTILGITGWRWVFLVNVPIAAAALVVVGRTLHLQHTRRDHRIDWWGAAMLTLGLVPLLIVAEQGREWGWLSGRSLLSYGVGIIGVAGFFVVERAMGEEALIPLRLFRIRTVGVASIASVFIGMGMFGGLAALPLYLQIVKGASPTQAGLLLLPLTLGIMFGSILSGQLISRTGRYRQYPIIGTFLLACSMWAFHYVGADTETWISMIIMVFFGMGLGFNFQPLTLAVQNAVSPRDIGVATSSATFTRQIGGTLGTAIFLSILFSKAAETIPAAYSAARQSPEFLAALQNPQGDAAANASFIASLKSATTDGGASFGTALSDSSFVQKIDPRLAHPYLEGFASSMQSVFFVATFILIASFAVAWFLPHVELRSSSSYNERGADEAAAAGTGEASAVPQDGQDGRNGSEAPALVGAPAVPADQEPGDGGGASSGRSSRLRGRHRMQRGERLHD